MGRNPNNPTSITRVYIYVHIHAHIHVHVDIVRTRESGSHRASGVVHTIVAIRIDVGGQLVIRVAGPVRQHAAGGLVRAIQNLINPKANRLVLLMSLVDFFDPSVLHCCVHVRVLNYLINVFKLT